MNIVLHFPAEPLMSNESMGISKVGFLTKTFKLQINDVYNSQTITHTFYWIQAHFVHFTQQVCSWHGNTTLVNGKHTWALTFLPEMHDFEYICNVKKKNTWSHWVYIKERHQTSSPVHSSLYTLVVGPCGCHQARQRSLIGKWRYNRIPDCCNDVYLQCLNNSWAYSRSWIVNCV